MGKGYYTYPQPLHLKASVGNSGTISGVNVIAKLTSPAGTVTNIPMYDDGTNGDPMAADGHYTALYSGYTENGQYLFSVHVDNASATGFYTVAGNNFQHIQSVDINTDDFSTVTNKLSFDFLDWQRTCRIIV